MTFVISVAHFQTFLDGELQRSRLAVLHGAMKDRLSIVEFGVDVCAFGQQVLEWCNIVAGCGVEERSGSFVVAGIDVDAVADRKVDAIDVASSCCTVEDRFPRVAEDHDVGAMLK